MKVESSRSPASSSAKRAPASAAPGFTPESEALQKTASVTGVGGVTALDAVLALQTEEPPAQRRARQLRRGGAALDALEELEKGILEGRAPGALRTMLDRLLRSREATGEAGLDALLLEIDTRLAVETAKLDRQLG
jgi:hypothetical protein